MPVQVKVCGVRTFEAAAACVDLGVDAIGLNFWPGTPRRIDLEVARRIVVAFGDQVELVGVFVDAPVDEVRARRDAIHERARVPVEVLDPLKVAPPDSKVDPMVLQGRTAQAVVATGLALRKERERRS